MICLKLEKSKKVFRDIKVEKKEKNKKKIREQPWYATHLQTEKQERISKHMSPHLTVNQKDKWHPQSYIHQMSENIVEKYERFMSSKMKSLASVRN